MLIKQWNNQTEIPLTTDNYNDRPTEVPSNVNLCWSLIDDFIHSVRYKHRSVPISLHIFFTNSRIASSL